MVHALLLAGLLVAPFDLTLVEAVHERLGRFLDTRQAVVGVPFQLAQVLALVAGVVALVGGLRRRTARGWPDPHRCRALLASALLGGGLLVNLVTKHTWGRPRPRQLELFGGSEAFHPLWDPQWFGPDRSFASGHAAAMAVGLGLLWLVPQGRIRSGLASVLLPLWIWVVVSRILAGAHFPSDVLLGSWLALLPLTLMVGTAQPAPAPTPTT